MERACRGVRGATTVHANEPAAILSATRELLEALVAENGIRLEDVASVIFSTTPDLDAEFPARAARELGWTDTALLCTHEMQVPGGLPRCIRVLIHWNTHRQAKEIRHVYLRGARRLRPDRAPGGEVAGVADPTADPHPLGTVAVIGLGLIGASLAGALRRSGLATEVVGSDADPSIAARAHESGLVDRPAEATEAAATADTIILATPVGAILDLLDAIAPCLRPGALVLDVGSTKRRIVERMHYLPEGVMAVGGHPMCGKETGGIDHADPGLFHGATFALCETERTDARARDRAERLVAAVDARPFWIDPEVHDDAVALISHLPYLLSVALVNTALGGDHEAAPRLAASGFRDTSRLAASDVAMILDVLKTNADTVGRALERTAAALDELRALLAIQDDERLAERLEAAAIRRREWFEDAARRGAVTD